MAPIYHGSNLTIYYSKTTLKSGIRCNSVRITAISITLSMDWQPLYCKHLDKIHYPSCAQNWCICIADTYDEKYSRLTASRKVWLAICPANFECSDIEFEGRRPYNALFVVFYVLVSAFGRSWMFEVVIKCQKIRCF